MTIGFPRIRSLRSGLIRFTKCAEERNDGVHLTQIHYNDALGPSGRLVRLEKITNHETRSRPRSLLGTQETAPPSIWLLLSPAGVEPQQHWVQRFRYHSS